MDDYAGEDLLRRQAVVSVDGDGRVADAEIFAEVVIFVRDALVELYDVYVVGHWDIDTIMVATYEEVALHCQSPDRGRRGKGSNWRASVPFSLLRANFILKG